MLGYLHNQLFAVELYGERILDVRKVWFSNSTSTTGSHDLYDFTFIHYKRKPPSFLLLFLFLRLGAADDLSDLLGNGGLTHTIQFDGKIFQHILGAGCCRVHSHHT